MSDYPDFTISSLLKGLYTGDPKPLAVDEWGNMIAMLKAMYNSTPTDLKCDVDGNIVINLSAQALTRLLVRPTYGGALVEEYWDNVDSFDETELFNISGTGIIYGAYLWVNGYATSYMDKWRFYIDGNLQNDLAFKYMAENYFTQPYGANPICTRYDRENHKYGFVWPCNVTFESTLVITYLETAFDEPEVISGISYAKL